MPYAIRLLSCLSVTLVYCGQTVGWINMKLGTEVGLGPGHIVLDGDPALPLYGAQLPIFRPCLLWPNGWMDQDATWYGGRPWPRLHCVRWGPSCPRKGHRSPPPFGPCLLWPNGRQSQLILSTCLFWFQAVDKAEYSSFLADRPRYSICINRQHLRSTIMRPDSWTERTVELKKITLLLSQDD